MIDITTITNLRFIGLFEASMVQAAVVSIIIVTDVNVINIRLFSLVTPQIIHR